MLHTRRVSSFPVSNPTPGHECFGFGRVRDLADVALEPRLLDMLGTHRKKAWSSIAGGGGGGGDGAAECCPEGLDLLDRMLCYDHQAWTRGS